MVASLKSKVSYNSKRVPTFVLKIMVQHMFIKVAPALNQ